MTTKTGFPSAALIVCGIVIGGVLDRMWQHGIIPAASARGRACGHGGMVREAIEKQNSTPMIRPQIRQRRS